MKPQYQIKDFIPDPYTHKDRWEIYDIKQGGMGWVYIVYDHESREPFAVKTYKDEWLQTEKVKEQFKKEALIWINLDRHENITQARLVLEIQNRIYLFLEYVVGGDLSRYISSKLLDLKQILNFALQFCYGMEHAVTHGIICHRDIKPGNCLITKDKTLKITDFGLAKALDTNFEITNQVSTKSKNYSDLSKTKTGETGGTPFYMAPEQFEDIKHLDIRSDIYSFGVMLYEMISGKLPYYGSTINELKENHKKKGIPDISSYIKKKEKPLIDIVYKCMAKQLENRYINFINLVKEFTQIYKLLYNEDPPLPNSGDELNANDLNNKGVSLGSLNQHQEAIKCYDKALGINPQYSKAWYNKGVTLANLNHHQESIKCYDKAIEIDPKDSQTWYNKGNSLGDLNRQQEAIECFNKAIEIDPKNSNAWTNKGVALENLNRHQEAIECYNKTLEIDPKFSNAWYNRGNLLVDLNYHQEAFECYDKAIEIDPKFSNAWFNKGVALENLNRHQEAIECYNKTLEIDPKFSNAWYRKGAVLVNLDYLSQALESFKKAKKLGNPDAEQVIAVIQDHLNKD